MQAHKIAAVSPNVYLSHDFHDYMNKFLSPSKWTAILLDWTNISKLCNRVGILCYWCRNSWMFEEIQSIHPNCIVLFEIKWISSKSHNKLKLHAFVLQRNLWTMHWNLQYKLNIVACLDIISQHTMWLSETVLNAYLDMLSGDMKLAVKSTRSVKYRNWKTSFEAVTQQLIAVNQSKMEWKNCVLYIWKHFWAGCADRPEMGMHEDAIVVTEY